MKRVATICVLTVLLPTALSVMSGCSTHRYEPTLQAEAFTRPTGEIKAFSYEKSPYKVKWKFMGEGETWAAYEVRFKVKDFENLRKKALKTYYYVQKDRTKDHPVLIIMPPTGGGYELSLSFAKHFADRGFHCLAMTRRERFFNPDNELAYNRTLFRQTVIDIRRAVDWLEGQPLVDRERISILGISLGSIMSQLAMAADDRIRAGALLLGAMDLPEVLDTSGYIVVKRLRKVAMERHGVDREGLAELAQQAFGDVDPKTYADRIDPADVMMVSGRYDNIIKYSVSLKTWETLGRPEFLVVPSGHYSAALYKRYALKRIYRFLTGRLGVPVESP